MKKTKPVTLETAAICEIRHCVFERAFETRSAFQVTLPMGENCIRIVEMGDSSGGSEEKYEIYEAGSDMFCVIGLDNNKQTQGKTPTSKPKYKQSYREAWESMRDFKGWLSSVPGNTSKAYCKLCRKELHCHRLSLLKHKVTFKHQKKEEEHKSSKARGERNETGIKVDSQSESTHKNFSNDTSLKMEVNSEEDDEDVIVTKATTSEAGDELFQEEEAECKSNSLSTHVLDISKGVPGALIHLVLYKLIEGRWTLLKEGLTTSNGRYDFLTDESDFSEGRYKLHYDVDKYFKKQNQETIFPFIEVVFDVKSTSTHYHIPLLLSPYGYSTYRGS